MRGARDTVRIGLIGDYDPDVTAHRAIPLALALAGTELNLRLEPEWIGTETISPTPAAVLDSFAGIWCVPASPYRSETGALAAIRYAREGNRPFLGTCGGFQHAVLEYARNVSGLSNAGHAEVHPEADEPVIAPLACSLVEAAGEVRFGPDSPLAALYGSPSAMETYHCRYGLNPSYEGRLAHGPLRVAARDGAGEVRALVLDGHPFYVLTLYQPERAALSGRAHPLVNAFAAAAARGNLSLPART